MCCFCLKITFKNRFLPASQTPITAVQLYKALTASLVAQSALSTCSASLAPPSRALEQVPFQIRYNQLHVYEDKEQVLELPPVLTFSHIVKCFLWKGWSNCHDCASRKFHINTYDYFNLFIQQNMKKREDAIPADQQISMMAHISWWLQLIFCFQFATLTCKAAIKLLQLAYSYCTLHAALKPTSVWCLSSLTPAPACE